MTREKANGSLLPKPERALKGARPVLRNIFSVTLDHGMIVAAVAAVIQSERRTVNFAVAYVQFLYSCQELESIKIIFR